MHEPDRSDRTRAQKRDMLASPDHHEIDVAADGSTTVPDFVARPMPTVRGVVQNLRGEAVPNAIVRFRDSILTYGVEPALTDAEGRFELTPPFIPEHLQTHEDKGLVIIGIHDNSMPLAAIQADVAREKMTYPIVVDHPDGRILRSYQKHGVDGYPSYLLIGPDGAAITDRTAPGPQLRSFKLEIVRELLMKRDGAIR